MAQVKRVTLVRPGAGELSALSEAGFDRAVAEFGLVGEEFLFEDSAGGRADIKAELMQLAGAGSDLVIVTSGTIRVEELAAARPDVFWVSTYPVRDVTNVAYFDFLDNEGAYLAGVAAAHRSKTGTIGFVGGHDGGVVLVLPRRLRRGCAVGRPGHPCAVPVPGRRQRLQRVLQRQRRRGPGPQDVRAGRRRDLCCGRLFGCRGVRSSNRTVDRRPPSVGDRRGHRPVRKRASAIRRGSFRSLATAHPDVGPQRVDVANYEILKDFAQGRFTSGARPFNVANGGLDISYSGGYVEDIRAAVEVARADIVSGRVVVPGLPTERETLTEEHGWFL